MAELHGGDEAIPLLVKVLQALDEVVHGVSDGLAGDVLQHGQEHFKSDPGVLLILLQRRENIIIYAEKSVSNGFQ